MGSKQKIYFPQLGIIGDFFTTENTTAFIATTTYYKSQGGFLWVESGYKIYLSF
jgi:hypothetical protein